MRRLALALLLVTAAGGVARAQPQRLDPHELPSPAEEPPEVLLVTFGEGARIFEKFGHAALCLRYPGREPVCFNYGVTNFNDGAAMVWHFLRGEQRFWVEPEALSSMLWFYRHEDRDIWMQPLPLTDPQARAIEHQLLHDIQEAHRYYIYDHFFNNCTTRLRDMIDKATGGKLSAGADVPYPLTFRQIGRRGLAELPPLLALSDFVVGRQLDDTPTLWQAMFHPAVLREQVRLRFGVEPIALNRRHGPKFPTDGPTDRIRMVLIGLLFALPLLVATGRRRFQRTALIWATAFLAFWGVLIWGLVVISSIAGIRWNEAVFVMVPLDLALPLLSPARRRGYARIRVLLLLLVSALVAIGVFHQPLWVPILCAIMPLAIIAFDLPHPLLRLVRGDQGGNERD